MSYADNHKILRHKIKKISIMFNTYLTYILNSNQNLNTQVKIILIPYKNSYLPESS